MRQPRAALGCTGYTRRSSARNIASVPCRCGHSWTRAGEVRALGVLHLGHAGAPPPPAVRRSGRPAPPAPPRRSRGPPASRSRRGPRHPVARSPGLRRAGAAATAPGPRGPRAPPPAALRAAAQGPEPGARRVHQHPVEGAVAPRRPGPVADHHVPVVARMACATSLARCGWRSLASSRAPRRPPGPRAAPPCRPVRRTGPATARPGRRRRRRATPAPPAASRRPAPPRDRRGPRGPSPGSPDSSMTASGDMAPPACEHLGRLRRASSSTVDSPGRATSVTRGRLLSAASRASSSSGRSSARASSSTTHSGWECRTASDGVERRPSTPSRSCCGDPAHHRVGEARPACARPACAPARPCCHGGVVGHPHRQQLVGPEPQRVPDPGVRRAAGEMVDHRVVAAQPAQRAADQLGREGRVASARSGARAGAAGRIEVGVGVVLAHRHQHVVRRQPGGVDARSRHAAGSPRGTRGPASWARWPATPR